VKCFWENFLISAGRKPIDSLHFSHQANRKHIASKRPSNSLKHSHSNVFLSARSMDLSKRKILFRFETPKLSEETSRPKFMAHTVDPERRKFSRNRGITELWSLFSSSLTDSRKSAILSVCPLMFFGKRPEIFLSMKTRPQKPRFFHAGRGVLTSSSSRFRHFSNSGTVPWETFGDPHLTKIHHPVQTEFLCLGHFPKMPSFPPGNFPAFRNRLPAQFQFRIPPGRIKTNTLIAKRWKIWADFQKMSTITRFG